MIRRWLLLLLVSLQLCTYMSVLSDEDDIDEGEPTNNERININFASESAGAVILEKSKGSKGYHNLLSDDRDKYGIAPCKEKKWLVIGLSEDILVKTILMDNYEKYSSLLNEFHVLGSTSYPTSRWQDLGIYKAEAKLGSQEFPLVLPSWARYLKFKFLSQHGDEFYCTLSQIKVYGSTVIETFKREVEISELEVLNMRNSISLSFDDELLTSQVPDEMSSIASGINATLTESIKNDGKLSDAIDQALEHIDEAGVMISSVVSAIEESTSENASSERDFISKAVDVFKQAVLSPMAPVPSSNMSVDIDFAGSAAEVFSTDSNIPDNEVVNTYAGHDDVDGAVESIEDDQVLGDVSSALGEGDSSPSNPAVNPTASTSTEQAEVSDGVSQSLEPVAQESSTSADVSAGLAVEETVDIPTRAEELTDSIAASVASGAEGIAIVISDDVADIVPITTDTADSSTSSIADETTSVPSANKTKDVLDVTQNDTIMLSNSTIDTTGVITIPVEEITQKPIAPIVSTVDDAMPKKFDVNCAEMLRYPVFKARMLAKLPVEVDKHSLANNDNVFKLLMQKIKILETNIAITELYASQVYECYRNGGFNGVNMSSAHSDDRGSMSRRSGAIHVDVLGIYETVFTEQELLLLVLSVGVGSALCLACCAALLCLVLFRR